jgi:predicted phosphodiesterase
MRIAIISDMHGNCVALDAVLADLRGTSVSQIICLGDAIQGGPQPAQVVQRLRELGCPVVMGNADAWLLTGEDSGREQIPPERRIKMNVIREWSLAQLSPDDRAFSAAFQPTVTAALGDERSLLAFHGSPVSFDDVILPSTPEEEFQRLLGSFSAHILTGGHTHMQQIRRIDQNFFFNPGSVGFAYSHNQPSSGFRADPWAEYAVLTVEAGQVRLEFRRLPFDVGELVRVYRRSGRPYADDAIAQYD